MAVAAAGGDELRVLGTWSSPWVIRVRAALGLKGLSYHFSEEDLTNKSDLLLKSNPVHGKVPVLIHGGRPVCESLVILEYIDEAWPGTAPPLLPSDPYDRATARFWAAYVNDTFLPAFRALFRSLTREQRTEAFENAVPKVETLDRAFRECSKGKAFFGGDAVGVVDIALGSHLVWIRAVDEVGGTNLLDGARFPGLPAWAERFMSVDAVRKVMPDAGKVLEQYKGSGLNGLPLLALLLPEHTAIPHGSALCWILLYVEGRESDPNHSRWKRQYFSVQIYACLGLVL